MKQQEISGFYDEYVQRQLKTGANERLISLYERLLGLGLKKSSHILELGCGVGIFTRLLSKKIKTGKIHAVDLSRKSVEVARAELRGMPNVTVETGDIVTYRTPAERFDFILLLDVIEHIPLSEHPKLFENLADSASADTRIIINVPNPEYLAYAKVHQPETLQVLEEEVQLSTLLQQAEAAGLELIFFEKYGIWEEEDYHFLVVRKKQKFQLRHLADGRTLPQKAKHKLTTKVKKIKYR